MGYRHTKGERSVCVEGGRQIRIWKNIILFTKDNRANVNFKLEDRKQYQCLGALFITRAAKIEEGTGNVQKQQVSTSQELLPVIHESSRLPLPRSTDFPRLGGHSSADSVMASVFHTGPFLHYCLSTGSNLLLVALVKTMLLPCEIALLYNPPSFSVFEATQCSTISPLLEKIWTPPLTSNTMWRNHVVSGGRHKEEKRNRI